jgi:hypothetical protein
MRRISQSVVRGKVKRKVLLDLTLACFWQYRKIYGDPPSVYAAWQGQEWMHQLGEGIFPREFAMIILTRRRTAVGISQFGLYAAT